MQPFGRPVVPEVKAMRQTSSAAVATASNRSGAVAQRSARSRRPEPP